MFVFWQRYLLVISVLFGIQGICWALLGSFDPFGFYETQMAMSFWGTEQLTLEAKQVFRFILVPFGATDAAYFLLFYLIVKYPFAKRERWAYFALLGASSFWFILDSALSLYLKAYFNIVIVNIPCALLLGIGFGATYPHFSSKKSKN